MEISDFSCFSALSQNDRSRLIEDTRKLEFDSGETVIARGMRNQFVYFILRGRVKESTYTLSGKEIVFHTLAEGDCFGMVSPFASCVSRTDLISSGASQLYAVRLETFSRLLREYGCVAEFVIEQVFKVSARFADKLYEMRALDVAERTRAEILRHAWQEDGALTSSFVEIADLPTHEEIANTIFTHREAVSREISSLKKVGVIVKTEGNRLSANVGVLRKMVADMFDYLPTSL